MASGSMFHRRAPPDIRELFPNLFVFIFGFCNIIFVCDSYFMFFFSKNFHMNGGFSSERHLNILSINFLQILCVEFSFVRSFKEFFKWHIEVIMQNS